MSWANAVQHKDEVVGYSHTAAKIPMPEERCGAQLGTIQPFFSLPPMDPNLTEEASEWTAQSQKEN